MKIRTRDKWRDRNQTRSVQDSAVALAYIAWQIALTATKNLHEEDFHYDTDEQRVAVIAEYLIFLVHVADRRAFEMLDPSAREGFVTDLAKHAARHYQRNVEEIYGRGQYAEAYLKTLNDRFAEYADTRFTDAGPDYSAFRCLGAQIQQVMGTSQTNKWVLQHVIDVDAPQAVSQFLQAMDNLFRTGNIDLQAPHAAVVGPD